MRISFTIELCTNMYKKRKYYDMLKNVGIIILLLIIYYKNEIFDIGDTIYPDTTTEGVFDKYPKISKSVIGPTSPNYLLNTPFCHIPNYGKTYEIPLDSIQPSNEVRAVTVTMTGNNLIQFQIDTKEMNKYVKSDCYECCYMFASYHILQNGSLYFGFTLCATFDNATNVNLTHEMIIICCGNQTMKKNRLCVETAPYTDTFILVRNLTKGRTRAGIQYNVLLLGIESMSRARAYATLPKTVQLFKNKAWLDYIGYQKSTDHLNKQVLAGKHSKCKHSSNCSKHFIWKKYKEADYFTAYAENIPLNGEYIHFDSAPADHYMRPYMIIRDRYGASKTTVFTEMLNYAENFVATYKNKNFFGTFWLHKVKEKLVFDDELVRFFERLHASGVLENTFVIFYSNQGVRAGVARLPVEAYYDERLPMLFVWSPPLFQQFQRKYHASMVFNQKRLTTNLDVYRTLRHILTLSKSLRSDRLDHHDSLLKKISVHRTCEDALIKEQFCACITLTEMDVYDEQSLKSINTVVEVIQNISKQVRTVDCMRCARTKLYRIERMHWYANLAGEKFHVVALQMSPQLKVFESILRLPEIDERMVTELAPEIVYLQSISEDYEGLDCVLNANDRPYCSCVISKKCSWV